jgi:hypothetical protein
MRPYVQILGSQTFHLYVTSRKSYQFKEEHNTIYNTKLIKSNIADPSEVYLLRCSTEQKLSHHISIHQWTMGVWDYNRLVSRSHGWHIDLGFSQNLLRPRGHHRDSIHTRNIHIKFLFELILFKPQKSLKRMLAMQHLHLLIYSTWDHIDQRCRSADGAGACPRNRRSCLRAKLQIMIDICGLRVDFLFSRGLNEKTQRDARTYQRTYGRIAALLIEIIIIIRYRYILFNIALQRKHKDQSWATSLMTAVTIHTTLMKGVAMSGSLPWLCTYIHHHTTGVLTKPPNSELGAPTSPINPQSMEYLVM